MPKDDDLAEGTNETYQLGTHLETIQILTKNRAELLLLSIKMNNSNDRRREYLL